MTPAKTNSSASRDAGVNAQYDLRFLDSQEESYSNQRKKQTKNHSQPILVNFDLIVLT